MTRFIKRGGKIWIRVFPDKPITKKPQETRMGKGKGAPEEWVCVVKPGRILFEMEGVTETDAREAMQLAAAKLPIKTQVRDAVRAGEGVMKVAELRDLGVDELQQREERELDEQLFRLRIQKSMGQLEAPAQAASRCAASSRASRRCCARRRRRKRWPTQGRSHRRGRQRQDAEDRRRRRRAAGAARVYGKTAAADVEVPGARRERTRPRSATRSRSPRRRPLSRAQALGRSTRDRREGDRRSRRQP